MLKSLKRHYNNLSMHTKIFLSFMLILSITFFLLLQSNAFMIAKETRQELFYSARKSLNQTKSFLDFKTASSREIVNVLAANSTLQNVLKTERSVYEEDIGLWSIDRDKLQQVLYTSQTNPDIKDIKIYMKDGPASVFTTNRFFYLEDSKNSKVFQSYDYLSPSIKWYKDEDFEDSTSEENIIVLKNILNENDLSENIGIIRFDFKTNVFNDVLNETDITKSAVALLINSNHLICTSNLNDKELESNVIEDVQNYVRSLSISSYPYWNTDTVIQNHKMIIGIEQVKLTDWQLILIIPESDVLESVSHTRTQLFSLFMIIMPLSLAITYIITYSFTKRLSALASAMHNLDSETFSKEVTPSSRDEIGILTQNFNYMLTKISMLLDEKYELGQAAKNSELMALQAQINPHFLYNTLDQIYWMGIKYNIPDMSTLVLELSKFYKLSLSKGKNIVTLKNELELIQAYVYIQNFRFDNMITLNILIPERYYSVTLPKITLQPIVENAIIHGICEKEEPGTISVEACDKDSVLSISISDDGIGMTDDTLSTLLTPQAQSSSTSHGYGLSNINNRLKILFGAEYGLQIQSKLNEGTKVMIQIPLIFEGDSKQLN